MLLALIVAYSLALIGLGAWISRRVRETSDFFVGGRSLGAGLLFGTFLAANIGAGSTVGATSYGYTDGYAAWWWNGSAGIGSLVLAFWIGPRIWREARRFNLLTVGDFLERHFGRDVRVVAAALIWLGSLVILCAQIKGASEVLYAVAGTSPAVGAFIGIAAAAAYFALGGLLSAAWVNRVQLVVVLTGFALAAPLAAGEAGGLATLLGDQSSFWRGDSVGWPTLFLLGPAFFLSPGLVQKAYAARSASSLRRGVAANGVALMLFAIMPVVIGIVARSLHPALERPDMALPTVLAQNVPALVGALALAAVFSAEISSADAVLFMLSTSGARDFYQGVLRPTATDGEVLRVARWLAVAAGALGYLLTFIFDSVVSALTVFYSVMVVTLFAPILGGLFFPRAGRRAALAAMTVGVVVLFGVDLSTAGVGYGWASPTFIGLVGSAAAYALSARG